MAFLNDPGLQALWQNVVARLNNLVEAVPGKGLSTNDYTDEDKTKVENAATGIGNLNDQISGVGEKGRHCHRKFPSRCDGKAGTWL